MERKPDLTIAPVKADLAERPDDDEVQTPDPTLLAY